LPWEINQYDLSRRPVGIERHQNSTKRMGGNMNQPRAADDFATIRARMEELRRDREGVHASERNLQLNPSVRRGGTERSSPGEISTEPGRVRQSGSGAQPDRDRVWWARRE